MRKTTFAAALAALALSAAAPASAADNLLISGEDLRLTYVPADEENPDDIDASFRTIAGFHLYIRKKDGMNSVLLCETTKDPDGKMDNFSFRAKEWNPVNGDEVTYLDGKPLTSKYAKYRLADSTPEADDQFGQAFHVYIPMEMVYGYPWERNGEVRVKKGTFINIRAFEKPHADYEGSFADNPFMFDLVVPPPPAPPVPILTDSYNPKAAQSFGDIADATGGQMSVSDLDRLPDDVMAALDRINPKENVDIVFTIDATGSMKDDVKELRERWLPMLEEALKRRGNDQFGSVRLGLLLYRDYGDDYSYKKLPVKMFDFTEDIEQFKKNMNRFVINGGEGGDIPEAVYEGLCASLDFFSWRKGAEKKIILIGDAEPHPKPRGTGKYGRAAVEKLAKSKGVKIDTIIVPDNKADRGRK